VKEYVFAVLILIIPAFGTITAVQSNANWSCSSLSGSPVTCVVNTTSHVTTHNLLAVWTFWQTSASFPYTASVTDSVGNGTGTPAVFPSALAPTVQSATTPPTNAQIFYAANINPSAVADTITVTFTCPYPANPACNPLYSPLINVAGIVVVEYSGADINYPLDSASAGYSYSTGSLLDSGNINPANSNLLVFGAGFADQSLGLAAGSGFTGLQYGSGSWGSGLVEDNTTAISGNNVLQRATACIKTALGGCGTNGDWLMQMAVFRDASWTVQGGWSAVRPGGVRYADQFPGADIGAQINNAIASLPANGEVDVSPGVFTFATQILPSQSVTIKGAGATYQNTGTHCATTLTWNGGATAPILITGTAASGTVLRDLCLNNTTSGTNAPPVFIDIDNGVGNTYLDHIIIDYPTAAATMAGIRWGATGRVNDSHCNNTFLRDTTFISEYQLLSIGGEFKGYNCRAVSDQSGAAQPMHEWQLGDSTQGYQVENFNCFTCDSAANVQNEVGIVVNLADNVNFFGLYCEQYGTTGLCLQIPASPPLPKYGLANGVNLYGPRFENALTPIKASTYAVDVELSTAKLQIDGGEMLGNWTTTAALVEDGACEAITLEKNAINVIGVGNLFSGPAPSGCMLYSSGNVVSNGMAVAGGSTAAPGGGPLYSYPLTINSGQVAMTTAEISNGGCGAVVPVTASGVLATDTVSASYASTEGSTNGQLTLNAFPSAGGINLQYCNPTAGPLTPAAINVNWRVTR